MERPCVVDRFLNFNVGLCAKAVIHSKLASRKSKLFRNGDIVGLARLVNALEAVPVDIARPCTLAYNVILRVINQIIFVHSSN